MNGGVLVAGIGNIFLGDDGFGVEVVSRLRHKTLPSCVRVVDFGIRSYDLAYALMENWGLVILVDSLPHGGDPGTLYTIEPELAADTDEITVDAHAMNPFAVLQLVRALGGRPSRMLVVGCEPATVDPDSGGSFALSAPVSAAVDEAVYMIEGLINRARAEASAA